MAGGAVPPSAWESNASGAIVHAFHRAYWGDWKFSVDKHDKAAETLHVCNVMYTHFPFKLQPALYLHCLSHVMSVCCCCHVLCAKFGRGGFQEARGSCGTCPFCQISAQTIFLEAHEMTGFYHTNSSSNDISEHGYPGIDGCMYVLVE